MQRYVNVGPTGMLRAVTVFCGSGSGKNPAFVKAAHDFGQTLAENKIRLVFGGGSFGLMGAVATAVLGHGGEVTGVIPRYLEEKEQPLQCSELIFTDDTDVMAARKKIFFDRERVQGIVVLPGGMGTLDELSEALTLEQLGRIAIPVVLANIAGFWNHQIAQIEHMREEGLIRPGLDFKQLVVDKVEDIIPKLLEQRSGPVTNVRSLHVAAG